MSEIKHRTWAEATKDGVIARAKCDCGWRMIGNDHEEAKRLGEAHKEAWRLHEEGKI